MANKLPSSLELSQSSGSNKGTAGRYAKYDAVIKGKKGNYGNLDAKIVNSMNDYDAYHATKGKVNRNLGKY